MTNTSDGGKKIAAKLTKDNPNYYSELAKKRKKPFLHFLYLKQSDPDRLKRISKKGGQRRPEIYPPGTFNH